MSHTAHAPQHLAASSDELFTSAQLREFDAEDTAAGRNIAKILTAFFVYTVLAMGVAIGWSFVVISH